MRDVRNVSPEIAAGIQVYFPMKQMCDFGTMDLVVRSPLRTPRRMGHRPYRNSVRNA